MAKKITFKPGVDISKMSETLKSGKIEHVRVTYKENKKTPARDYIIVRNVNKDLAITKCGQNNILGIKNARHFEMIALSHDYYSPRFKCKCRQCGKEFESPVKEAVWCSKDCRHAHRIERLKAKKNENRQSNN